jgi:hypothetical protein
MPLSWNEIRHRAIAFSKEWKGETREAAERQSFWNDFFNVFGVRRRTAITFALFRSVILSGVEGSLSFPVTRRGLKDTGRDREIPRWPIVSDY